MTKQYEEIVFKKNKAKMRTKFEKVEFSSKANYEDWNQFIIWLVVLILSIIFFYSITNPLLKWIFLASIVVLSLFAVNETVKKLKIKKSHKELKETTPYMNRIRIKVNFRYGLWVFGVSLIIFGLLILFIVQEIQINSFLGDFFQIFSIPSFLLGFALFFFGTFGKISEGKDVKLLRGIELGGLFIIMISIYTFSFSIIQTNRELSYILFYGSLLLGLVFIFLEEIFEKKRYNYILILLTIGLLLITAILDFLIEPDNFFFYRDYNYYQYAFSGNFSWIGLLDIIETFALVIFFLISGFYLIDYKRLQQEEFEHQKKLFKDLITASFSIWFISVAMIIVFSLYI